MSLCLLISTNFFLFGNIFKTFKNDSNGIDTTMILKEKLNMQKAQRNSGSKMFRCDSKNDDNTNTIQ